MMSVLWLLVLGLPQEVDDLQGWKVWIRGVNNSIKCSNYNFEQQNNSFTFSPLLIKHLYALHISINQCESLMQVMG